MSVDSANVIQSAASAGKDLIADEGALRAGLAGATDATHAKLAVDAYDKLSHDVQQVKAEDAGGLFAEIYMFDKEHGVKPLIEIDRGKLSTTDDATRQFYQIKDKFASELAIINLDQSWSKAGKGNVTENASVDAKNIDSFDNGSKLLDTFTQHMQEAFQIAGSDGIQAYADQVNHQLDLLVASGKGHIPYQIKDLMYTTCACDQVKPGNYGEFALSVRAPKDANNPDGLAKLFERKF